MLLSVPRTAAMRVVLLAFLFVVSKQCMRTLPTSTVKMQNTTLTTSTMTTTSSPCVCDPGELSSISVPLGTTSVSVQQIVCLDVGQQVFVTCFSNDIVAGTDLVVRNETPAILPNLAASRLQVFDSSQMQFAETGCSSALCRTPSIALTCSSTGEFTFVDSNGDVEVVADIVCFPNS
jgi:hypothetical protein